MASQNIEASLDRIFAALRAMGREIVEARQPGIAPADMAAALQDLGLGCPAELAELYAYSNGLEGPDDATIDQVLLFPGYYWQSLETSVENYRAFLRSPEWNRAWFPVFASGGGDFYAVICDPSSPDFGRIVGFLIGEPDQFVEFTGLAAMLDVVASAFEQGAYYLDDVYLEADYPRMREISRALQPGFEEYEPG